MPLPLAAHMCRPCVLRRATRPRAACREHAAGGSCRRANHCKGCRQLRLLLPQLSWTEMLDLHLRTAAPGHTTMKVVARRLVQQRTSPERDAFYRLAEKVLVSSPLAFALPFTKMTRPTRRNTMCAGSIRWVGAGWLGILNYMG